MNFYAFVSFINIIVAAVLGVWVYSKDPSNRINKIFLFFSFISGYTAFCEFFRFLADSEKLAWFWNNASFLWPFFPVVFFQFILMITKSRYASNKALNTLIYLPGVVVAILHSCTNLLYDGLTKEWFGWDFIISKSIYSSLVPVYFLVFAIPSFLLIIRYYFKQIERHKKQQAFFALLGLSIPTLTGFIIEGLLPKLGYNTPPLNSFSFMFGAVFLSISVLKYKFFIIDPSQTIKKMFSTIGDYLLLFNSSGNIILVSQSLTNCVKMSEDELIEQHISKIFNGSDSTFLNELVETIGKEIEIELLDADNKKIPISAVTSIVQGSSQKDNFYLLLGRDLRERKHIEEQLLNLHRDLEEKIQLRTADLTLTNERLSKEIEMRKEAEQKILASLTEKETLLREIHHRVKNNLQIVSSLLYLQSKNMKDTDIPTVFQESQNRIRAMGIVHEKLYQNKDFLNINFSDYLFSLISHIQQSYKSSSSKIKIEFELEKINVSLKIVIPLGLTVNEIISNIFKYAFPKKDSDGYPQTIWIKLKYNGDQQCALSIKDNGVGLPADFEIENLQTLGMKLIYSLVEQINGSIEYNVNGGTEFLITFPNK